MAAWRSATDRKTPLEAALGHGKKAVDGLEQGRRGRGEMESPSWEARQPLAHLRVLAGGVLSTVRAPQTRMPARSRSLIMYNLPIPLLFLHK
jgi:hypothetical protein